MQFTNKQELHPNDNDIKGIRSLNLEALIKDGKISEEGEYYLKKCCLNFAEIGFIVKYEELANYISTLPLIEQWLIKLPESSASNDCDNELKIISANLPFFPRYNSCYYIPSSSIINFFLQKVNPFPMEAYPIFGDLKFNSVLQRHKHNEHPVSLYAPLVKSNPYKLDGFRCGPIPMWIHDIAHIFWGSMFTILERNFVINGFIPCLEKLKEEANMYHDNQLIRFVEKLINKAQDLDLSNIHQFKDPNTRLIDYLRRLLFLQFKNKPDAKLGSCVEDRFLFLLFKMYFSNPKFFESEKATWEAFFLKFFTKTNSSIFIRQSNCVKALLQLAQSTHQIDIIWEEWFTEELNNLKVYPINWGKLQKVLDFISEPSELWNKIDNESLISLILNHHFHNFPPYMNPNQNEFEKLKKLTSIQTDHLSFSRLFPSSSTASKKIFLCN